MWLPIVVIAAVAVLALWLRSGRPDDAVTAPPAPEPEPDPEPQDDEDSHGEAVVVSSDGWAFVPQGSRVQLVPPPDVDEAGTPLAPGVAEALESAGAMEATPFDRDTHRRMAAWRPGYHLSAGDLVASRVRRGAPDFDPWRLEGLGRDGDYRAWPFETEDAARTALALLERRIVRPERDEDGEPRRYAAEDFEAARRRDEETERALDAEDYGGA